jgi:hypothetical protein
MQGIAVRLKAVEFACIAVLLSTAAFWLYAMQYQLLVRSVVAMGAVVVAIQAMKVRCYSFVALFAAIVVLYNPVVPIFGLSGVWQLMIVLGSVLPFAASLMWLNATTLARKEHSAF